MTDRVQDLLKRVIVTARDDRDHSKEEADQGREYEELTDEEKTWFGAHHWSEEDGFISTQAWADKYFGGDDEVLLL